MKTLLVTLALAATFATALPVAASDPSAAPPPLPGIWEVTATWDDGYAVARDTYQLPAELALGKLIPRGQDFTKRVRFIPGFGYNERLGG